MACCARCQVDSLTAIVRALVTETHSLCKVCVCVCVTKQERGSSFMWVYRHCDTAGSILRHPDHHRATSTNHATPPPPTCALDKLAFTFAQLVGADGEGKVTPMLGLLDRLVAELGDVQVIDRPTGVSVKDALVRSRECGVVWCVSPCGCCSCWLPCADRLC